MVPKFLIRTASFTYYNKGTQIQLGSLMRSDKHNGSLFFLNAFTSDRNNHKGDTFTVSYLIDSCGVSPKLAMKVSNKVHLKNSDTPNAVLDLLNSYGFSKTHVAKLVVRYPLLLVTNAENTLLPKLKFFHSIGVSNSDMPKVLITNYCLLWRSLEKCLIPRYEVLKGIVGNDEVVVRVLRSNPRSFFTHCDIWNDLVPNIEVLRQRGVPQALISLLMVHFPGAAFVKHSKFVKVVIRVEEIGFDPSKTTFVLAVQVLSTLSEATWKSRFKLYERWGWDHELALQAFRKFPNFMKLSQQMFTKKMSFLVTDMGLPSEDIAKYPQVLAYSLKKRIIPRFSLINILKSKGLIADNMQFSSFIGLNEEKFLEKFVITFQKDLPHLPGVYKSLIGHQSIP